MSQPEPAPAFLFYGEDEFQSRDALRTHLDTSLSAEDRGLTVSRFDGGDFDVEGFRDALDTVPLFGSGGTVVLENVQALPKGNREALPTWLAKRAGSTCVALTYICKDKKDAPPEALVRVATARRFEPLTDRSAVGWITERARTRGVSMDRDAASTLAGRIGPDSGRLASEVEKYLYTLAPGESLSAETVRRMTPESRGVVLYQFLDAVFERRALEALKMLDTLAQSGEGEMVGAISVLGSTLATLNVVRAYKDAGLAPPPYLPFLWKLDKQVDHWTSPSIERALLDTAELDRTAKQGGSPRGALETFILLHGQPAAPRTPGTLQRVPQPPLRRPSL
jgi:DNA polymerase III delta subunit